LAGQRFKAEKLNDHLILVSKQIKKYK